jgi:hypothetical protein
VKERIDMLAKFAIKKRPLQTLLTLGKENKIKDQLACKEHQELSICHFLFIRKSCTPISPIVTNAMEKVINICTY